MEASVIVVVVMVVVDALCRYVDTRYDVTCKYTNTSQNKMTHTQ